MQWILTKVWAVVLAAAACTLLSISWYVFFDFRSAQEAAACGLELVTNTNAVLANASAPPLPTDFLGIVSSDAGYFATLVCAPPCVEAALLLFASVMLLLTKPPNPACAKFLVGLAHWSAVAAVAIYLVHMAWYYTLSRTDWASDQHEQYEAACNASATTTAVYTNATTNATAIDTTDADAARITDEAGCGCLLSALPECLALWGPATFALGCICVAWLFGRVATPSNPRADRVLLCPAKRAACAAMALVRSQCDDAAGLGSVRSRWCVRAG